MRLLLLLSCLCLVGCSRRSKEVAAKTETVSYSAGKETIKAILNRPSGKGPFPAVVVIHGDFGVTDSIREHAHKLAELGYVSLAVDLYRGDAPKDLMDAHILDRALPDDRARDDLKAAVDYLCSRSDVEVGSIGVIGWDSGGGHALDAALADERLKAVVTCYGRLPTEAESLKPLRASVLALMAGKDAGIDAETRESFKTAMHKAGKHLEDIHVFKECGHGFMNPADPKKAEASATSAVADAWKRIEEFFDKELKR
jgi:carboxymethylenebutenolidase